MGLFRRAKPLHRQLADDAGLSFGAPAEERRPALAAEPPGWDGEQRGAVGIHGVSRARRWDVVATAVAPGLAGDAVHFTALPDGTLLVEEDEPAGALDPLAHAVEKTVRPPYAAEGVRRGRERWAVAARRIVVVPVPGLDGDQAELAVRGDERTLSVDGQRRVARAPTLETAGAKHGRDYVVRATRLDGELWQVESSAL
ncbi:MAG TPA: hypothetical protein VFA97_07415 [Gaiellaceae bacterium]|nr:hypothetical protein [Gaiellaceae bacterium]